MSPANKNNAMTDLFYSESTKTLFWVAGYTKDSNTSTVAEITQSLTENAQKFADIAQCRFGQVKTHFNQLPPRYQYMRVFYVDTDFVPKNAFRTERTMWDVLKS